MFRIFPAQAKDFISILYFYCLIVLVNVDFQGFHNSKNISQRHQHCGNLTNSGLKSSDADIKIKQVKLCQAMSLAC